MAVQRRSRCAVLGLLLPGLLLAGLSFTKRSGGFTPYVSEPLPQRALGDFDGDGRSDTAFIREGAFGRYVSIQLSGSAEVSFEATVVSLTEGDIDHDGDLDLVAAMPSGDVLIWLNDGHGRFTPKEASAGHGLTSEPVIVNRAFHNPMAVGVRTPVVVPSNRVHRGSVVLHARPPTSPLGFDFGLLILPAFRAPPVHSV
jgi:hypothetical protein